MDGGGPGRHRGKQTRWAWLRVGAAGKVRVGQEEGMCWGALSPAS